MCISFYKCVKHFSYVEESFEFSLLWNLCSHPLPSFSIGGILMIPRNSPGLRYELQILLVTNDALEHVFCAQ